MMRDLQRIEIPIVRWRRWHEAASTLGWAGVALAQEVAQVQRDPTRHKLGRAAKIARLVERSAKGDRKLIANAIATEIEDAASIC
jgi:hypothetical protein